MLLKTLEIFIVRGNLLLTLDALAEVHHKDLQIQLL